MLIQTHIFVKVFSLVKKSDVKKNFYSDNNIIIFFLVFYSVFTDMYQIYGLSPKYFSIENNCSTYSNLT